MQLDRRDPSVCEVQKEENKEIVVMSKSETSDVQEKLIVIWERDSDNADEVDNLTKEFKFITEILKESHPTRILKMSVQVIERFCTNHELSQFVGEGFQSLLDLIQSSSEKPLRIMAAQSVSRIAQSAVQSDADALLASVETILQSETTELLVCRPLRDASQYLKQLITSSNGHVDDDEQREENEDFQNDQGTYDPRYLDEEDANEEEGDDENDRGNEEHDGVSDTVTLGAPFDGSNEELLDALSSDIKDTLKTILSQINDMRLLEIRGRLKSFFRPNLTSPEVIYSDFYDTYVRTYIYTLLHSYSILSFMCVSFYLS